MATYPDLSPLTYFDHPIYGQGWSEVLIAVGWLGREVPYPKGEVDLEFVRAFAEHLRNPWQPVACGGFHPCGFCRLNQSGPSLIFDGQRLDMGASNVFVPADGRIYCAPSALLHYVDAHEYRPPEAFRQAVLACPPQNSMDYKRALLENGGRRLLPSARHRQPKGA